jgi:hypothetical protein
MRHHEDQKRHVTNARTAYAADNPRRSSSDRLRAK